MSIGTVAHAQVTQQWVQLYNGGGGDPLRGDVTTAMAVDFDTADEYTTIKYSQP